MKPPNRELSWVYHPTGTRDRSQKKTQRSGERERAFAFQPSWTPTTTRECTETDGRTQKAPHPMSKPGGLCALVPTCGKIECWYSSMWPLPLSLIQGQTIPSDADVHELRIKPSQRASQPLSLTRLSSCLRWRCVYHLIKRRRIRVLSRALGIFSILSIFRSSGVLS
jgi:hypothetical protein